MLDVEQDLIIALTVAMEEVSEDTQRIIKSRIKDGLEMYIKRKEKELEKAKEYAERCLQSDDNFSKETEDAVAEEERLSCFVRRAKELLEMLPPDRVREIITTSGVHYVTES